LIHNCLHGSNPPAGVAARTILVSPVFIRVIFIVLSFLFLLGCRARRLFDGGRGQMVISHFSSLIAALISSSFR
jgi:hypothetical protein